MIYLHLKKTDPFTAKQFYSIKKGRIKPRVHLG